MICYRRTFIFIYLLYWLASNAIWCLSTPNQFGAIGTQVKIKTLDSFPDSASFFIQFVFPQVPVSIKQGFAVKEIWKSDEALLGDDEKINEAKNWMVPVELHKKENRTGPRMGMPFYEFLQTYKNNDQYLVEEIPNYLAKNIVMPYPLQCEEISEAFLAFNLWFSSGGTISSVHTDDADNIVCVLDGLKEWIIVDPHKHNKHAILDVRNSSYSSVDVDDVDLDKFPNLADTEYILANLSSGDCLYVPYKWIHQVRSYERSVAINIWWNPYHNENLDLTACDNIFDPALTVDKIKFKGYNVNQRLQYIEKVQDIIENLLGDGTVTSSDEVFDYVIGRGDELKKMEPAQIALVKEYCKQIFTEIDTNGIGQVVAKDLEKITIDGWNKIQKTLFNIKDQVVDVVGYYNSYSQPQPEKVEL